VQEGTQGEATVFSLLFGLVMKNIDPSPLFFKGGIPRLG
jgi:hypothetical protein